MGKEEERNKEVPREIETKIPISDLPSVRERILAKGGKYREEGEGVFFQRNTFLDCPDKRLSASDQLLRVREVREGREGRLVEATLTWKGKREEGEGVFKIREEVEVEITDPQEAIQLLERLEFTLVVEVFEKEIEHLELDGVKIDLNKVPFLGSFVELEGPKEKIMMVVKKLGLNWADATSQRYEELLQEKFGDVPLRDFTFRAEKERLSANS